MLIQFVLVIAITALLFLTGQYTAHQKIYWFFIISCMASYTSTSVWKQQMFKLKNLREKDENPSRSIVIFGSIAELISGFANYLMIGSLIWILYVISIGIFNRLFK